MRPSQCQSIHRRNGFTLLEVLVALAIFVGAAAALSRLAILGVENAEFSQWNAQAWSLIESRFEELSAGILTLENVGTIPMEEAPGWQCTMFADSTELTGLYRVTIEMRNVSGMKAEGFAVKAVRYYFDESSVQENSSSSGSSTGGAAGNSTGTGGSTGTGAGS